jgi:hypothetical protein
MGLDNNQQISVLYLQHKSLTILVMTRTRKVQSTACLGRVHFRRMKTYGNDLILTPFSLSLTTEEVWLLFRWYPIRVWAWAPVILTGFLRSLCTEFQNGLHPNSCPIIINLQNNDSCPSPDADQCCWVTTILPDTGVETDEKLTQLVNNHLIFCKLGREILKL